MSRFPVPFREYLLMDASTVVKFLILSDVIFVGARGLITPIFAIFATETIPLATAETIGLSTTIYLIAKSVFQVPASSIMDKIKGERDDFNILFFSSFFSAFIPLLYLFMKTPLELYAIQFLLGVAYAFVFPSYMAIFTRHIDRGKEGVEWAIYFTLVDIGSAVAAAVGGILAVTFSFYWLIICVVLVGVVGSFFILPIKSHMRMPVKK